MHYSRTMLQEILLFAEIVLMVIFLNLILIPLTNALIFEKGMAVALGKRNQLIYCSQAIGTSAELDLEEIAAGIGGKTEIYQTKSYLLPLVDGEAYLIVISEDLYQNLNLEMESGMLEQTDTQPVPVVVSGPLAQSYKIGDSFSSLIGDELKEFVVSGTIKTNGTIVDIHQQLGSFKNLYAAGFPLAHDRYKSVSFALAVENQANLSLQKNNSAAVFRVEKTQKLDTVIGQLESAFGMVADFHSFSELSDNLFREVFEGVTWEAVMLFLFCIVIVFNYTTYIIINTRRKQHMISILIICGLSSVRSFFLQLISVLLLTVPAVLTGLVVSPTIMKALREDSYGYSYVVSGVVVCCFLTAGIVGVVIARIRRRNTAISLIYKTEV